MDGLWSCPACGSRGRHYNRTRLAMVCDQCGRAVPDPQQDQQRQQYDRAMQTAREHLRVGNWEQCRSAVQPWLYRYPSEKLMYQLLLAAWTCGYGDLLLTDQSGVAQARNCWEKLTVLHGINGVMRDYARRRIHARQQQLKHRRRMILIAVLLAAGMLVVGSAVGNGLLWFLGLLGAVLLVRQVCQRYDPAGTARDLRRITAGQIENPFDI